MTNGADGLDASPWSWCTCRPASGETAGFAWSACRCAAAACAIVHGAAGATATANATTKSTNVRRTTNDQGPFLIQREHRTSFRLRQCIARDEAGERVSCWIWATMSSEGIRIIAVRATVGEGTRSREVSLRARSAAVSAKPQAPLPVASERTSQIKASWHRPGGIEFKRRRGGPSNRCGAGSEGLREDPADNGSGAYR